MDQSTAHNYQSARQAVILAKNLERLNFEIEADLNRLDRTMKLLEERADREYVEAADELLAASEA